MTILEKADELGKMLVESDEFKRFQLAETAQKEDEDAQVLLVAYNYKRSKLMKKASNENITREEMLEIKKELEAEYEKLKTNKNILEYIDATEKFNTLMGQINAKISGYVSPSQEGCSGDCTSCGGCH